MRASEFFQSEVNAEAIVRLTALYLGYRVTYKQYLRSDRIVVSIVQRIADYNGRVGMWCWCEEGQVVHFMLAERVLSREKLTAEELLTHHKAEIRALAC